MHYQIIVVYPKDVELDDVMYPYAEIDKTAYDKIKDERCQFFLMVPEKDIPDLLIQIKEKLEKRKQEYLEMIQYRSEHSVDEFKEKYGHIFDFYIQYMDYCKWLREYDEIKNLPIDDPRQIDFITEWGSYVTDKWIDIYIPGSGYGAFENPYELCDYYRVLATSKELNYVGEMFIIFCEKEAANSRLYTIDDIRFNKKCNKHCRVDNLEEKVSKISEKMKNGDYLVSVLDIHR